jgi:hypothetical protein
MGRCVTFALSALVGLLLLGGCSTYYRVTDPATGKTYYTRDDVAWRYTMSGTVSFRDTMTENTVTLASSEIKRITKEEFEAATGRKTTTYNP